MKYPMHYPGVGTGIYIRRDGRVLLGLRKSQHGNGQWCSPGGKLDMNESPEDCVRRETLEETGLVIKDVRFVAITNDVWREAETHFLTVTFVADWEGGEAKLMEPDKFEKWGWFEWDSLPEPLFLSTRNFVKTGYNPFTL